MPSLLQRGLRRLYRTTRPFMPPIRHAQYAGVPVRGWVRVSDFLVPGPWRGSSEDHPAYEESLVRGIRALVRPGDRVIVVGGGNGVTSVIAADAAGPDGSVQAYEASDHMLDTARHTLRLSPAGARVTLHHAVVAENYGVYGDTSAAVVPPPDLPPCDVLVMDCEGAERDILPMLAFQPRAILVETHGVFGAPTDLVRGLLEQAGYAVTSYGLAEYRFAETCITNDIHVLVGQLAPTDLAPSRRPA